MSISIIADGVIRGIDSYAIFYKQDLFYHKTLGSLAKMYRTQFYWDPDFEKKAGEMKYHYSTFA
nr:hypothetical protein [Sedimentibacter sp.]